MNDRPSDPGRRGLLGHAWGRAVAAQAWRPGMSWLVLGVCLLATGIAWQATRGQAEARAADRFRARVERISQDIHQRMLAYDQVLKSAAGLFAASVSVERHEWRAFVLGLGIDQHYPGIQALGYIEFVPGAERESFLHRSRLDFPPNYPASSFDIAPPGEREDYFVVKFVEPIERNVPALGYDIGSEARRRQAALVARDQAGATLSGRLRLVQSTNDTAGVLLLRPIYANQRPADTLAERRAALEGWVYGAFQMSELMHNVLRDGRADVDFEIFDGAEMSRQTLLYDHDGVLHAVGPPAEGMMSTNSILTLVGRAWSIHFRAQPDFGAGETWNKPKFIALAGICVSLLVFGITRALASTQARAQALARDITRTLQVQEQAMSSSSNAITILDATRPELPIIYANSAVERTTGYPPGELLGHSGSVLLGPEPDQPGVHALRDAVREGRECRAVLRCYRKNGTAFWNEVTLSPVRANSGVVTHFVSISADITDRLEAERHLETARQAAEAASRAKSEFLANMSHEIRTPLNGVLGMTELVLETPLSAEQRRHLATVRQSATELLALVNDVLDFSKIEAGKLELHREAFRLRDLLESCLDSFRPRADEKGLGLSLRVASECPGTLLGDAMRLRQVLLNLLGNAIKFTERGQVQVEVELSGKAEAEAVELQFTVNDTGIGIPKDKHDAIFQALTQADGSITRRYGGTGLGLAISRQLVTLMDGRIWVESTPGRGSRFRFTVRMEPAPEGSIPPALFTTEHPPAPKPARRRLRVLVAEDNPVNAQLAGAWLGKLGHRVRHAADGHEAVAAVERGEADLVLMDVQMPGLDGYAATARIRERESMRGGHLPIIAVTAHALAGDREQCLAAGMDAYLTKPLRRRELFATLERLVPGSAPGATLDPPTDILSPLRLRLLTQFGGDAAAVRRMAALCLETTPRLLVELRAAAQAADAGRVQRAAHTLKGSLLQLGDEAARAAAVAVESAAISGETAKFQESLVGLEREVARVMEELRRLA